MTATKAKTKAKSTTVAKVAKKPGTAVMIRQEGNTPGSATATMVALAQSKDFDAVKFQALAEFQEKMIATQARINFDEDFFAMQAELPSIARDGKITIRDKNEKEKGEHARVVQSTPYATFPNIMKVINPILQRHNFTLRFMINSETDGRPKITGALTNTRGGHSVSSTISLQLDTTGSKNNVQGAGSAVAYGKRYVTVGLLNLVTHATEDKDDDGAVAGDLLNAPINAEQLKNLKQQMKEVGANIEKFNDLWGINDVSELQVKNFEAAMRLLSQKKKVA